MDRLDNGGNGTNSGSATADGELFPLSPAQLGIWYAQHVDPQVPVNIAQYVELHGELDVDTLTRASLDASHELGSGLLRIVERDGEPLQYVDHSLEDEVRYVDLRTADDPAAAARDWMRAEYGRPLDLTADRLIRAAALHLGENHWYWYVRAHHIVIDGYGAMNMMNRMAELYTAYRAGVEPAPSKAAQLRTLYDQEIAYRESNRFRTDKEYWAERVAGLEEGTSLAGRTAAPAAHNGVVQGPLTDEQNAALEEAVHRYESSPAQELIAAFAAYLAQWNGVEDVILSLPVTARTTALMRRSGGVSSNIVPLRLHVGADTTTADLRRQVQLEVSGALRHQRYRHEDIRRDAAGGGVVTTEFFGPWVNIMLFQDELRLGDSVGSLHVLSTGSIEDLGVNFYQSIGGTRSHIDFETNPNLYTDEEATRHHTRFLEFFDRFLAAEAAEPVWQLAITTAAERTATVETWNDAAHEVPDTTLPELLDAQIARTPGNLAVEFEGTGLTYAEFGARVDQLARYLIADGVGPESLVALGMRRSLDLVVAMHAVLRAGGAYVPIDPDHPAERTAYILESAAPVCVLTVTADQADLPESVRSVAVDTLDTTGFSDAPITDADRLAPLRPDNTAYVIYTSGSTGRPKGVAVSHRAIVNQQLWMLDTYGFTADDVYLQKTATTFDVSLWGYFLPLMSGATLIVATPDGHRDPAYVAETIARHGVTVTDFVPSMLTVFASYADPEQIASLRAVFVIGEALPPETVAAMKAISGAGLHNLYGPTEAAVSVTYWEATTADTVSVPIGVPEWNVGVQVLDARLRPAAIGAPGELYLSGRQLARGYLGRPDLSADRFVADPLGAPGDRMYRTGDLVRWRADGVLEYLGRTDFQVKFRGQRIELGEIETDLLAHPAVSQAVVLVVDTATGQQLAGYVVPAPGHTVEPVELSRFLGEKLPSYMVPAALVVLDALPLNTSGKLDRKALPEPVFSAGAAGFRAPRTQAEQIVAAIFADILGQQLVGVDDNFFDLGGNSLVATQVVARISAAFGVRIGVRALFETPTVAGLAARIDISAAGESRESRPPLVARSLPDRVPLSPAQQRMWFINQFDPAAPTYNLPFVIRLRGHADIAALTAALDDVIERQQSLRTLFPESEDGGYQLVLPMDEVDLGIRVERIAADRLPDALAEFAATGFDVTRELPIRVRLYEIADGRANGTPEHAVAIVVHHISADGFSFGPLSRDVAAAYVARATGQEPSWAPLPVQYRDYSVWQRELLGREDDPESMAARQITYWRETLEDLPDQLDLPTDRPRPAVQGYRGAQEHFAIDAELHERLSDLARGNGSTLFMVLHAALAVLLSRLSGTGDIAVGTPVAGRGEQALDDLIGMFVNTLVLRSAVDGTRPFTEFLDSTREADLAAFAHADVPFERLVEVLNPARSQARQPLVQVMLSFQEISHADLEIPGLSISAAEIELAIAKFDLVWTVTEKRGSRGEPAGMDLVLSYATDLFDESTVRSFVTRWQRLLDVIVDDPHTRVGAIELLHPAERAELTACAGGPAEQPDTLAGLLAAAAVTNPDGIAVIADDESYTYAELDSASNQLARVLIERGAGPEVSVALALGRSWRYQLALWAIVKSGAVLVPVDPAYPADRIIHMVTDSGAAFGLTEDEELPELPELSGGWISLDDPELAAEVMASSADAITDVDRRAPLRTANTAYMIYTSGSTGLPKGVAVTHAGLRNFAAEQVQRFGLDTSTRALAFASPSFDASVLELLLAVGAAGTMVIVPQMMFGGAELADLIETTGVTHAFLTPSVLASLDLDAMDDVRVVITGGEAIPADLAARWAATTGRRLFNAYGPTEATIATNISGPLRPGEPVTIGGPVRGMRALVLDTGLDPVPEGVVGELYVGGIQLARGYHARSALTAGRFVADPYGAPGERLYRTGDVVRWRRDGSGALTVEYVGRNDFQVKVRGFRIELGEIDAALTSYDAVDFAVTIGHENVSGAMTLVSYVVAAPGDSIDVPVLTAHIQERLPAYMVPSSIMVLDEIPLTPAGKLDRKALPVPQFQTQAFRAPVTPIEEIVADVFAEVLGVDRVGLDDDFFELGGNSLIATQVAARLGAALDTRVPVRTLFEASTVMALAARIESHVGEGARQALVARSRDGDIPLSLAQQRMWFLNRYDTESAVNNIPVAIRMSGELDVAALQVAIIDVIDRHESLRTVFPETGQTPVQVILDAAQVVPDLTPFRIREDKLIDHLIDLATMAFDVTDEVPLHARLFEISDTEYVLGMVVHHISADGWSMGPLARDVMVAYAARISWESPAWVNLPVQYADYALWQREVLGSEDDPQSLISDQIRYWKEELAGLPDELALPADRPRPAVSSYAGGTHSFVIEPEMRRRIADLGRQHNASPFMVVHSVLAALLARLTGESDIAVGTPVAGRGEAALENLVGMFVNTLVLRTQVQGGMSFAELLATVRNADLQAFAHADVPFERLVEVLNPTRSQARHPFFQVALSFENLPDRTFELPELRVAPVDFEIGLEKFDLSLNFRGMGEDTNSPMQGELSFSRDLFDPATAASFADRFMRLLEAAVTDPSAPVGDFEVLDRAERARVLAEWNATGHALPPKLLLDGFERAVASSPDRVAVSFEGTDLTYVEFAARVNRLARHLVASGVGPETLVGLLVSRSVDLVVGMYAVVAAGGAYVPLDPAHPAERIGYILETAAPVCLLSTTADVGAVPAGTGVPVVELDTLDTAGYDSTMLTDADRLAPVRPSNTAYVIFTSGSTGRPKGVAVSHSAIANQVAWMLSQYPMGSADVYLQKTATTFDVSLWGYFLPLAAGARLVVATPDGHRDPAYLARVIAEQRVTVTDFVPSMLTVFAAHTGPGSIPSLRHVFVIGEALPPETVTAMHAVSDAAVHNLYGPTEAAVSITYWQATGAEAGSVPIGVPQWNSRVYVLDGRLRPVPEGVTGELYLAGDQLARGYVTRPDLSSDRFVASPFDSGRRMYRTGDLVRWTRVDGDPVLEYLGRTDFQVKFRGQRIELGEIESALLALPQVSQAVVTVAGSQLGEQLVAYVVPAPGAQVVTGDLLATLRDVLPVYMVPAAVVELDAFPLNTSGKLDRKALPEPVFQAREFRAPSTPIEEIVANVFADVLGMDRVGADDDFFSLGGNSLIATQVAARLGGALDTQVPVRALFEAPTVTALAARVQEQAGSGGRKALVPQPRPEQVPLSLAQQRMWFLNRFDGATAAYNIPFAIRLSGDLDVDALRAAVADVVARHEVLRTVYPETDSGPVQVVVPVGRAVPQLEVRSVAAGAVAAAVAELARSGFDVTTEVPLRVALFRLDEAADTDETSAVIGAAESATPVYVLALVVHHIAGDGFSVAPLTRDVMVAYSARSAGETPGWAPLPVQYADYALWQRERLGDENDPESLVAEQLAYWQSALADVPDQLDLPMDRPRPAVQSFAGHRIDVRIDPEIHAGLLGMAREQGATLFMVVHAAFAVLLSRLSGSNDITIGTPVAGRGEQVLDELIGMFVNTLVFRTQLDRGEPFVELLARQRETDLAAFAHADVPFERLVEVLNPARSQARHPLFQVGLTFQNLTQSSLELPGLSVSRVDVDTEVYQYDLNLILSDSYTAAGEPDGVTGFLTYATDLFDQSTVQGFVDRFARLLTALVADPTLAPGAVEILDESERAEILSRSGGPAVPARTLPELLAAAVAVDRSAPAVVFEGRRFSYGEFDERSNRLARVLIELGLGAEDVVAVAVPRSADSVLAEWAVTKSGAAFLPIDPTYPEDRIAHMLTDSGAPVGITVSSVRGDLPDSVDWLVLDELELEGFSAEPITEADRVRPVTPGNTAYVIYTSGSTGVPKGVVVTHTGLANFSAEQVERYRLTPESRALAFASPSFDASILELLLAVGSAGALVVVPTGTYGGAELGELIAREGVTVGLITPSVLASLDPADLAGMQVIIAGGEAIPADSVARWSTTGETATERRFHNAYGPTEATIATNISGRLRPGDPVTIGGPVRGMRTLVLDDRLNPVPEGVIGELYVGGCQLARGYHARPGLTAERFVADPYGEPGSRLYRTGDVVRWGRDGMGDPAVEYVGRNDFQVKIRGFRIELGEIDAALTAHDAVDFAVTVGHEGATGAVSLVSYVVAVPGFSVDTTQVREFVGERLPSYMVPASIVVIDRIPLTPAGKLDRRALPEPVFETRSFRAPSTPIEEIVAGTFAEVLAVQRVGADDDFFTLGGNSLLATQVAARLGRALNTDVPVRMLFETATVSGLAVRVEQQAGSGGRKALVAAPRPEQVPLSLAQQRMWFLNRFDQNSTAYNIPWATRLTGHLDLAGPRAPQRGVGGAGLVCFNAGRRRVTARGGVFIWGGAPSTVMSATA
ncbi:non-ribosomal peptide synthetase [Nocardia carnea]|uniref:non-ribosomal peptide synthetase n=1 Tax=Nocardia carnea TaxID=37328 RepID=UPI002458BA6C|nr:non-ribosomal peptide synthetase [Nocardia carnea]